MSLALALSLLLFSAAPAEEGPGAAIARWKAAVSTGNVESVRLRGDLREGGLDGTFETILDGGARKRVTTWGRRSDEQVFRAGRGWQKDWNGKVQELQGRDLKDAATVAAVESLIFGGAVDGLDPAAVESGEEGALRFRPTGGAPFDLYLDAATGLPARVERLVKDTIVTLTFSDWRTVGALQVPFAIAEGEDSRLALREVVPSPKRSGVTFDRPQDGAPDYRFARGSSALSIPFNFENDHLMVKGQINGAKPSWFMVDTGAAYTVVNRARLQEMGLQSVGSSSITGGGGSTDFSYADVAKMELPGVTLLDQRVGVMDLRGLERIYGMPMGGILGYDFLSRFALRVDYDASTIDLFDARTYVYRGKGTAVSFVMEGQRPHLPVRIAVPGAPAIVADLVVDSGAAGTLNLNSPFVRENLLLERARKAPPGKPNTMAGSEKEFFAQTSVPGKIATLGFGPFEVSDVPATLMVGTTGAYASKWYAGVLGQGLLERFNHVYDYARSTMILEPRGDPKAPFPRRKGFGATFLSDGPDYTIFTVTAVTPGSPADKAGLEKGDVVTAVDGKPASELRLADVRRLFLEDGAHRVVDLRRGEEAVKLDFTVTVLSGKD